MWAAWSAPPLLEAAQRLAALPDVLERPRLRPGPVHLGGEQQLGLPRKPRRIGKTGFLKTPGAQTDLRTDAEGAVMLQLTRYFQVTPREWESPCIPVIKSVLLSQ